MMVKVEVTVRLLPVFLLTREIEFLIVSRYIFVKVLGLRLQTHIFQ